VSSIHSIAPVNKTYSICSGAHMREGITSQSFWFGCQYAALGGNLNVVLVK